MNIMLENSSRLSKLRVSTDVLQQADRLTELVKKQRARARTDSTKARAQLGQQCAGTDRKKLVHDLEQAWSKLLVDPGAASAGLPALLDYISHLAEEFAEYGLELQRELTELSGLLGNPANSASEVMTELRYEHIWLSGQARHLQQEADQLYAELQPLMQTALSPDDYDQAQLEGDFMRLVAAYPQASDTCREQLQSQFASLCRQDDASSSTELPESVSSATASRPLPQDEHVHYMDARRQCLRESGAGISLERLAELLPHVSRSKLQAHDAWYKEQVVFQTRVRGAKEESRAARTAFLREAALQLAQSAQAEVQRESAEADKQAHKAKQQRLHETLGDLRTAKEIRDAKDRARLAKQLQAEREAEAAREASEAQRQDEVRQQVARHKQARLEQQEQLAEQAAAAEAALSAQEREHADFRQSRIAFRLAMLGERQAARREHMDQLELEQQQRQQRMDRIRAQVSVSAERDPDRVLWATESFAADVEERTHSPFKQMYSFNTDDMLRDQRFRVLEALSLRGLQSTPAGKRAISQAATAVPVRADTLSHNIAALHHC